MLDAYTDIGHKHEVAYLVTIFDFKIKKFVTILL